MSHNPIPTVKREHLLIGKRHHGPSRLLLLSGLIGVVLTSVLMIEADASRRPRTTIEGAAIGAGLGYIVDGRSGARRGAAAGALISLLR